MEKDLLAVATSLILREARYLDRGCWSEWVAMYRPDATYWVPAWRDEYETITDPQTEVSLIFHDTRLGLEERIARIESRKSITALPLPRTVHVVSNIELLGAEDDSIETEAAFAVHVYDVRTAREHTRYGRYEHSFRRDAGGWLITAKKITLINDKVPTALDFFSL